MIFKPLHARNYVSVEQIGYGNAFRYNSKVHFLCSSSNDVPLKDDKYMYGMDTGGQIWRIPRTAVVEELPVAVIECNNWDEANAYLD